MNRNSEKIRHIIEEELSKTEVKNIIDNRLESFIKEKALKSKIKEITIDVFEDFFREMWQKKSFWKGSLKK